MMLSIHVQVALEATSRLNGHEARMADLQKGVDSAQRLMRAAQQSAREATDEKAALVDKVGFHLRSWLPIHFDQSQLAAQQLNAQARKLVCAM